MTTRRDVLQSSLSAGELSADLAAREDVEAYFEGAIELDNFFPQLTAGATKRPGFVDLGAADSDAAPSRLLAFVFSRSDVAYLEVCNLKINVRSWDDGAIILSVTTPYAQADLDAVRVFQSADVLFITTSNHEYEPRALKRFSAADWQIDRWEIRDGPWLAPNDTVVTLQASGTQKGASVTLTAAFVDGFTPDPGDPPLSVFNAEHVGALFEIGAPEAYFSGDAWQQEKSRNAGDLNVSDGNVYEAQSTGTTGANQPLHDEGVVNDGGVDWLFRHDGAGTVRITAVTDGVTATGVVERELPSTQKTKFWREGAFSDFLGWPAVGFIYEERIGLASTRFEPDTVNLSRSGDFSPFHANFRPGTGFNVVTDADAVKRTLADGEVNPIFWAVSHARLYLGTANSIKRVSGPTLDEPITPNPGGAVARDVATEGAADVLPSVIQDALVYASSDRARLLEYVMQETDRDPRDLTVRADQVGDSPIVEMATVKRPFKRVYLRRADGSLYCLTYDRRENFVAFNRVTLGGGALVESIIAAPGMDGFDDLVMIVLRNGKRRIYRLARPWRAGQDAHDQQIYLDGARAISLWNVTGQTVTYPAGAALTQQPVSGPAGWLAGAAIGDEIWLRAPGARSDNPASLTVYRSVIDAIAGDVATATYMADIAADMTSSDWALPKTSFAAPERDGETVRVLGDGYDLGDIAVAGGQIVTPDPAAAIVYGDFYKARLRSMPLATGTDLGSSRGEVMLIEDAYVKLRAASGGRARAVDGAGSPTRWEVLSRHGYDENLRTGLPPLTVNRQVRIASPHADELSIEVESDRPTALTLLGLKIGVTVNED